jgi:hypothetical protein
MVKYCVANECPVDERACSDAAENGHLECLKYLHEEAKAPWDSGTAAWAAENGHLHILEYLVERKFDKCSELACANAAMYGHLECLKYLHETAKAPRNSWAVRARVRGNRMCTIPPRQQLSITIWLAIRRRSTTHARVVVVIIIIIIIIVIIIVVEKQTQTREETCTKKCEQNFTQTF